MDVLALVAALILVLLNGFFVATEFAIVKVRPTRIEELIRAGKPAATLVRLQTRNLDGYLSATQLGITLASLALGWIGEPAFARLIEEPLQRLGYNPLHVFGISDETWVHTVGLASAFSIITFLHIVVGELAPKSLAILRSDSVAMAVAFPMRLFYVLFYPATHTLNWVASLLLRVVGLRSVGGDGEHGHSEEEIKIILSQARSAGLLSAERSDILRKAMTLPNKTARHLMMPRNEVVFLDVNLPLDENLSRARLSEHTNFPLCRQELDDVLGVVDIRHVVFELLRAGPTELDLTTLAQPAVYFPETMSGERLLTEFRNRRVQMAIIVDEYGGASGIVTAADIVTLIMGELEDDDDVEMIPLPGGAYDVDGTAPIDEVAEALKTPLNTDDMRTVAGFLMERLGRMPQPGDRVVEGGFSFNVLEVVGPRVRRVRVQREAKRVGSAPRLPSGGAREG